MCIAETVGDAAIQKSLELSSTHHSGTIVMIVDRQASDRAACGQTRAAGSRERYSQAATGGSGGSTMISIRK